jgi:hypothetical protein
MGRGPETSLLPYVFLKKWMSKLIIFNNYIAAFEKRYLGPKTSVSERRDLNRKREKKKVFKEKNKIHYKDKNKNNNKKKNV